MSELVTFDVVAADPATEIFLVDGSLRLVDRGIGRASFSVTKGIYKLKTRAGAVLSEQLVVVQPGMESIVLARPKLRTAIPLTESLKTSDDHIALVRTATTTPTIAHGRGSSVLIVSRCWMDRAVELSHATPAANPAQGLQLRQMDGTLVADVEHIGVKAGDTDPCVVLHVELDPGPYRFALCYKGRHIEQSIVACAGWQTRLFLLVEPVRGSDAACADVIHASITMARRGEVFDPDSENLRLEEIGRVALVENRRILSPAMRDTIMSAECPPMLALIGAHLLIREAKNSNAGDVPAQDRVDHRLEVRGIVDNLRRSIGAHPDVEAVAIGAGIADSSYVFGAPPLFRASWRLLLKASASRPELLPPDSFCARIAERLWGEGAWLFWLDPEQPDEVDRARAWQTKAAELLAALAEPSAVPTSSDTSAAAAAAEAIGGAVFGGPSFASPPLIGDVVGNVSSRVRSWFVSKSRRPFPDLVQSAMREASGKLDLGGRDVASDAETSPFPAATMATGHAAAPSQAAAPPVDLAAIRNKLTDQQWRSIVKSVGIPLGSIHRWLDERKD